MMNFIRSFSLAMLISTLIAFGFHLGTGDYHIFDSDFASLTIYFAFASVTVATAIFLMTGGIAMVVRPLRSRFREWGIALALVTIIFYFLVSMIWYFFGFKLLEGTWLFIAIPLFFAVGFVLAVRAIRRDGSLKKRVEALSVMVTALALIALPSAAISLKTGSAPPGTAPARHVILLVVDHLSTGRIAAYNPEIPKTDFDSVLPTGRVFHGMQVVAPYTHAFFSALFRGKMPGSKEEGNLLERLQSQKVSTQISTWHRNAIPEAGIKRISSYKGLRSRLLGPESAWVPRFLGLDYHLNIEAPHESEVLSYLWKALNPNAHDLLKYPFVNILIPEFRRLQSRSAQSFSIIYIQPEHFLTTTHEKNIPTPPIIEGTSKLLQEANINDNHYKPTTENEKMIASYEKVQQFYTSAFLDRLAWFVKMLKADPDLRDTLLIVTSDHGSIAGKGRLLYSQHPQREVIRTPLFIFGDIKPEKDDRLLTTTDLSQTLLDYFDIGDPPLNAQSVSLVGTGEHEEVASLTHRSTKYNEWFLLIFRGETVIRLNVHPNSPGSLETFHYDGFTEIPEPLSPELLSGLREKATKWLYKFRIHPNETNLSLDKPRTFITDNN